MNALVGGCWRWEFPGCREKKRKTKEVTLAVVKEDVNLVPVTKEDAKDGVRWKQMICSGNQ